MKLRDNPSLSDDILTARGTGLSNTELSARFHLPEKDIHLVLCDARDDRFLYDLESDYIAQAGLRSLDYAAEIIELVSNRRHDGLSVHDLDFIEEVRTIMFKASSCFGPFA